MKHDAPYPYVLKLTQKKTVPIESAKVPVTNVSMETIGFTDNIIDLRNLTGVFEDAHYEIQFKIQKDAHKEFVRMIVNVKLGQTARLAMISNNTYFDLT